jgi:hypothetical protein
MTFESEEGSDEARDFFLFLFSVPEYVLDLGSVSRELVARELVALLTRIHGDSLSLCCTGTVYTLV